MARRGRKSLVFEVTQAITAINYIGTSKKEAEANDATGIHSIKQIKETLSASQNFIKWIRKEFGIGSIFHLTTAHYIAYLEHLCTLGRSTGHRQNVETALRHLQKGMNVLSFQRQLESITFVPDDRVTDWKELKPPRNRSYSHNEFEIMLPFFSPPVEKAVKLMRYMGLRVKEASKVQVNHFIPSKNGGYELNIKPEEAKGITKGGRYRITPVPKHFETELLQMLQGMDPEEKIVTVKSATARKKVNEACKKAGIEQNERGRHIIEFHLEDIPGDLHYHDVLNYLKYELLPKNYPYYYHSCYQSKKYKGWIVKLAKDDIVDMSHIPENIGVTSKEILYKLQGDILVQLNRFYNYVVTASFDAAEETKLKAQNVSSVLQESMKNINIIKFKQ